MTITELQSAKTAAMKNKDDRRKRVLSEMIDQCQKAALTNKGRVELTEQLVDEALLKYQKIVQEMIDTCPESRPELKMNYQADMAIVVEFAPQLMTDKTDIKNTIIDMVNNEVEFSKSNRGKIMKIITPYFKGKADMKIVSEVVGEMLV